MINIGDAVSESGIPAKTIRYYETIGLISPARDATGYRRFNHNDIHKLTFLGHARGLGFTIEDCRTLLSLYEDESRTSADVKQVALNHLAEIEQNIGDLRTMHSTLTELIDACAGDQRPDCPILRGLEGTP